MENLGLTVAGISIKKASDTKTLHKHGAFVGSCTDIDVEGYYKKYGPMILRRCRSILKDEDAAFDAMQEVFVRLLKKKDSLRGDFPSSLLYRIATNICLNMIRCGRSIPVSPDDSIISTISRVDDANDRFIANDFLDFIFRNEQDSTRTMAYLHFVDGMTYEEVAQETGLSVSGVRKRLRVFKERVSRLRGEAL